MDKNILLEFINKYSLGGAIEQVKWNFKPNEINVISTTSNTNAYCNVSLKHNLNISSENKYEFSLGIQKTSQLKKLISVLNNKINIIPHSNINNIITHLEINDDTDLIQLTTMDSSIIADCPNIVPKGNNIISITFTTELIDKFIKAKNALSEYETCHIILNENNELTLNVGYSSKNTNRISINLKSYINKINIPPNTNKLLLSFNSEYLKQMLNSNLNYNTIEDTGDITLNNNLIFNIYYVDDDIYMGSININNKPFNIKYALFKSSNIDII